MYVGKNTFISRYVCWVW